MKTCWPLYPRGRTRDLLYKRSGGWVPEPIWTLWRGEKSLACRNIKVGIATGHGGRVWNGIIWPRIMSLAGLYGKWMNLRVSIRREFLLRSNLLEKDSASCNSLVIYVNFYMTGWYIVTWLHCPLYGNGWINTFPQRIRTQQWRNCWGWVFYAVRAKVI
jgi:hypothetical protein